MVENRTIVGVVLHGGGYEGRPKPEPYYLTKSTEMGRGEELSRKAKGRQKEPAQYHHDFWESTD